MKNIFSKEVVNELTGRIHQLSPTSKPLWGKMTVAQMLAHCNVAYELIFEDKHTRPGPFKKMLLKLFVKGPTVSDKPYKQSIPTGPMFIIKADKDFEAEKNHLVNYLNKACQLGDSDFDGRDHISFGKLTLTQWNNMLYKHLNHHLKQFGV